MLALAMDRAAEAFVDIEAAERNANALTHHTHCLHSSLFSLVLAAEQPDLFRESQYFLLDSQIGVSTHRRQIRWRCPDFRPIGMRYCSPCTVDLSANHSENNDVGMTAHSDRHSPSAMPRSISTAYERAGS